MEILLVMTNLPDQATAETLAAAVVERRLAACVNILSPCRSVYQWRGSVETEDEVPLMIKTTKALYPLLESAIRDLHPYETPEIIAVQITNGLPAYLSWVASEVMGVDLC